MRWRRSARSSWWTGLIPDAQIRIYPDSAHGFLFQYPAEVATEVNAFLRR